MLTTMFVVNYTHLLSVRQKQLHKVTYINKALVCAEFKKKIKQQYTITEF